PSRISKVSNYQQRQMTTAVKKSRNLGLLPQGMDAHDKNGRVESVSPKPFEF
ncbi:MAG: ribosomal protein S18, partial [Bdellovibrionales bacterium]|nr:ribosomal protein S18 [Bdellovibrionales bacterium]